MSDVAQKTSLDGRCVVVTRAEAPDGPLGTLLAARGATVRHWPVVQIRPPEDAGPLEAALTKLDDYDWIVFSSARAVAAVTQALDGPPSKVRVAVVGESTAEALRLEGWPVHLTPREFGADGLVAEFSARELVRNKRVLYPAGSIALSTLPEGLDQLGAQVDRVVAYRTVRASLDGSEIDSGSLDAVTFTSPSAVLGLHQAIGGPAFGRVFRRIPAIAIGPTTAEALLQLGVSAAAVADPSTLEGVVEAVVDVFNQESG